jgi:hypothetical protein
MEGQRTEPARPLGRVQEGGGAIQAGWQPLWAGRFYRDRERVAGGIEGVSRDCTLRDDSVLDKTGKLAAFAPGMSGALDRALQQFLNQVEDLGSDLAHVVGSSGLAFWLMILAGACVTVEATRWEMRRRGRFRLGLATGHGDKSLSWIDGLPGAFSTNVS